MTDRPQPPDPAHGDDRPPSAEEVAEDRRRSRRSVTFIVGVVLAAVAVMAALAAWVLVVPYDVEAPVAGVGTVACDADPAATTPSAAPDAVARWDAACEQATDDARASRRNTAFVVGVGAFVVATAVSTWPSRRLTGERLGPLR